MCVSNYHFRSDLAKSCEERTLAESEILKLTSEISKLASENKKLNGDLDMTRIERDNTVSDMRQEIERLNLLQGDQKQKQQQELQNKQQSESFCETISQLELEKNELFGKVERGVFF